MAWFGFFSSTSTVTTIQATTIAVQSDLATNSSSQQTSAINGANDGSQTAKTASIQDATDSVSVSKQSKEGRRFSFQSIAFKRQAIETTVLSPIVESNSQQQNAGQAAQKENIPRSTKLASQSALTVRTLIVGPTSGGPKMTAAVSKPALKKVKLQLLEPKKAVELINQLRKLPPHGDPSQPGGNGPIHAVCLSYPDEEEAALHFEKLAASILTRDITSLFAVPGVIAAPLDKLAEMYKEMHIIDLLTTSDLGLGQPGDGEGLLAGAVPTAETVLHGFEQVTPQLMALGFATGKLVIPDHTGINPPVDRLSVLTYWWGLELLLPPPSLRYLSSVQSVTGAIMNFLSALALVDNGVREILPFIRYISQFIDFEFNAIKSQDKGNGVVCAATWVMPAAMVPRPWDFPIPDGTRNEDLSKAKFPQNHGIVIPSEPLPRQVNSIADIVANNNPPPIL